MTAPGEERYSNKKKFLMIGLQLCAGVALLGVALYFRDGANVLKGTTTQDQGGCVAPCVPGTEDIMKPKEHGTSHTPVQENLRWGCDGDVS